MNRLLGKKSPIIDIEHMQLFSDRSIRTLLERSGLSEVSAQPFYNTYSIRYWTRLAPLPGGLKSLAEKVFESTGLERLKLSVNVGNTMAGSFRAGS